MEITSKCKTNKNTGINIFTIFVVVMSSHIKKVFNLKFWLSFMDFSMCSYPFV
jgi:hypothetical protein